VAKARSTPRTDPGAAQRATTVLVAGGVAIAAGLAIAGTYDSRIGGAVTLLGWALSLFGLHRFGRLGPA
jgi:hypothetical protein